MEYKKQHLSYEGQVGLMADRGLIIADRAAAMRGLQRIGYYRLSGYAYAFRQVEEVPFEDRVIGQRPIIRLDAFEPGVTWEHLMQVYDFDQRLRRCLLDGVQQVEVGLRVGLAYRLGKRGAFAHMDRGCLNSTACDRQVGDEQDGCTAFDRFMEKYERQRLEAREEEFVKHFIMKYDGRVPIWAAVEFMTMGSLISLFRLADAQDRRAMARKLGVKDPQVLQGWLMALNVLRNRCAHNGRIWNRAAIYPPDKINERMVDDELHVLKGAQTERVYFLASLTMYLLRRINADTRWANDFRTAMGKFPKDLPLHTPKSAMGVPDGWTDAPLWRLN